MADLSGVLGRVPGLAGYLGARQLQQQEGANELQQAQTLMGILGAAQQQQQRAQAMREEQEIKGVLQASGGDMGRAIQALAASGNPRYIEMGAKLKALSEKPQGQAIGAGGLLMPDKTIIPPQARPTDKLTAPPQRNIIQGDQQIQLEMQPDGQWKEVGRGPRFARQVAPVVVTGGSGRGKPPAGYRYSADGETLEPIPGGPAADRPKRDPLAQATYNAGLRDIQRDEKDLASASQMENALKRWAELNADTPTGRIVGVRPAIAQPQLQELQQLQSYLAVNNFKPGQGQISNFERQLIKGAGPNVMNDPETNQRIVDIQLGAVQNARDRAAFREQYLEANGKLLGADKAWNEYLEKNPRYTKGQDGAIIPNKNRKAWTDYFGGQRKPAAPAGGARSVLDEADAILRGSSGGS